MFITLEGIEGAGKSTQLPRLRRWLEGLGLSVLVSREPGGSPLGRLIRPLLLDARNQDLAPESELFLYMADRAQHVRRVIMPALAAGQVVLCDRFADSTVAYQGYGRGVDLERLAAMNQLAQAGLAPDLTLLFDLDAAAGLARARARNAQTGLSEAEGRFEALELDFHRRVRRGYLELAGAQAWRFRIVDAAREPDAVFEQARAFIAAALAGTAGPL